MKSLVPLVASGALLFALSASAQDLTIGSPAPELHVTEWVKGKPITVAQAKGNNVLVVEFWATWCGPCIASMPHLSELQKRFADKGVRIIGMTGKDPNNSLEQVEKFVAGKGDGIGYAVAFDADRKTNEAWMEAAGERGIPCSFVIDKTGTIAWIGHPMAGLDQVLEDVLAGTHDIAFAKKARSLQHEMNAAWQNQDWDAMLACADQLLEIRKDQAMGWAARFQAYDSKKDKAAVKDTVTAALQALKTNGPQLAMFVEHCVLPSDDETLHGLAIETLEPLQVTGDLPVRIAYFKVLDACGMPEKALQAATAIVAGSDKDAHTLGEFATTLASSKSPRTYAEAASKAIATAQKQMPESLELLRARFQVEVQCANDTMAAENTGRKIVERLAGDATELNSFAWTLLTEEPTKGRFQKLALHAAETMAEADGGDEYFMLDTQALAKFENGLIDEAIELQKKAIEKGGKDDPEYEARLKQYQEAKKKKAKGPDRDG